MATMSMFCSKQLFKVGFKELYYTKTCTWSSMQQQQRSQSHTDKMLQKEEEYPSPSALRVDTASRHSARTHCVYDANLILNVESDVMSLNCSKNTLTCLDIKTQLYHMAGRVNHFLFRKRSEGGLVNADVCMALGKKKPSICFPIYLKNIL